MHSETVTGWLHTDANIDLKIQCGGLRGIHFFNLAEWNIIFIRMVSLVNHRMKIRINKVYLHWTEPFIVTEEVCPLPQRSSYCTVMFLQQLRLDKSNICSEGSLLSFS